MAVKIPEKKYIRVGTDYFKIIEKKDRFGIIRTELKKWNKAEIQLDEGYQYLHTIPKFDDFTIDPNNNGSEMELENMYNLYAKNPHKPKKGKWAWTETMLKQVFGDQYEAGLIYLQVLYMYPKKPLPVLVLVSKQRSTGKSTFLDWLNALFGANVAMIESDTIGSTFNGEYAGANIIAVDETILDKQLAVERIKSLSTRKFISVNIKNVQQFKIPFFGKIIMASNNEDKFMKVDKEEIRFWIRKLGKPTVKNHDILDDMVKEIPAFLHHLSKMQKPVFSDSRMVLTPEQIKNEWLDNVVQESKSGLFHEICELFTDLFSNYTDKNEVFYFSAIDVKKRFFEKDPRIGTSYIRRVLEQEFELEKLSLQRYKLLDTTDEKVGVPFFFVKKQFTADAKFTGEKSPELSVNEEDAMPF